MAGSAASDAESFFFTSGYAGSTPHVILCFPSFFSKALLVIPFFLSWLSEEGEGKGHAVKKEGNL